MNKLSDAENRGTDDLKQIPKWTRRYGQNQRFLAVLLSMAVFMLLCAAIGVPSYVAGNAYRTGNMPLFWLCMVGLALACAAVVFISVPWWGGRFYEKIFQRLCAKEGTVTVASSCPTTRRHRPEGVLVAFMFAGCILGCVVLGLCGYIPQRYMQPVSALYMVPFLVYLFVRMRPEVSAVLLLWPGLYALHAVLIVAGAPILFRDHWEFLNMFLPVAGYGGLTALLGFAYARFALHRLRKLAVVAPQTDRKAEGQA